MRSQFINMRRHGIQKWWFTLQKGHKYSLWSFIKIIEEDGGRIAEFTDLNSMNKNPEEWQEVKIKGSPQLQSRIRDIVYKYKHAFSSTILPEPARVTPLDFEINAEEWYQLDCMS